MRIMQAVQHAVTHNLKAARYSAPLAALHGSARLHPTQELPNLCAYRMLLGWTTWISQYCRTGPHFCLELMQWRYIRWHSLGGGWGTYRRAMQVCLRESLVHLDPLFATCCCGPLVPPCCGGCFPSWASALAGSRFAAG